MVRTLRRWFAPIGRHPVLTALLLGAAGLLLWWGGGAVWISRERAAAEADVAACDFAAARARLARCLRLGPNDPETILLAAQVDRRDGRLDAAAAHLDAYRRACGAVTEPERIERALIEAQRGQVHAVVPFLGDYIDRRHPAAESALEALATGCVQVYQLDRARFWVDELLARFPANPVGRLLRAQTAETYGKSAWALGQLRRLVADYPRYAKAREALAGALFVAQEYAEAIEHYDVWRARQPDSPFPLLGLARCRDKLGQPDQVRPLLRQLEADHPDCPPAMLECGRFALNDGRLDDAERLLRRAVELAPHERGPNLTLAVCLEQRDKPDEAARYQERFRRIEDDAIRLEKAFAASLKAPNDPGPRAEAGRICLRNGQTGEGLRWLYGALEIAPDHAPTHAALADFFAARGDTGEAELHRARSGTR